jgi:hypothetical protein
MMKPQDIVVMLKLCLSGKSGRPKYADIARELKLSPSETHSAVRRLKNAALVHGPELGEKPNLSAIEEFLLHGAKYVFPAVKGRLTRGMATSYAAAPLKGVIAQGTEPPPVWPTPNGEVRGFSLKPLYKTVPEAANLDPKLYELLALFDAIRDGRARERKLAEAEILKRLRVLNG